MLNDLAKNNMKKCQPNFVKIEIFVQNYVDYKPIMSFISSVFVVYVSC